MKTQVFSWIFSVFPPPSAILFRNNGLQYIANAKGDTPAAESSIQGVFDEYAGGKSLGASSA
jgi:hypothetical protein